MYFFINFVLLDLKRLRTCSMKMVVDAQNFTKTFLNIVSSSKIVLMFVNVSDLIY